jgi:predicted RNase H-like nuclease
MQTTERNKQGTVIVGFDSAWTDNPKRPGAICAVRLVDGVCVEAHAPLLVGFDQALEFIAAVERPDAMLLVALDQPIIVNNETRGRPVDRTVGSVVGFVGGGVQSANRKATGYFYDGSPARRFVERLGASVDPCASAWATDGRHLIEVFPALALPGFEPAFYGPKAGPKYNPEKRGKFKLDDWRATVRAVFGEARRLGCEPAAQWALAIDIEEPRKAEQDKLDAIICLLVGLRWSERMPWESARIGCTEHGYIITPVHHEMCERLRAAATRHGVPFDGGMSYSDKFFYSEDEPLEVVR